MGSASPQIKTLISLAYDNRLRRSDKNLTQIQRHLQILSVVSDLTIFEPSCMETLEFYVCLEQLISNSDAKSPLAGKVMNLYAHIIRSPIVKAALRDEMHLMPVITNYFLTTNLNTDKAKKTLLLLKDISCGIKLDRVEAWLLKLIPYLASYIIEQNELDEINEAALMTLTNLCRGNHSAISILKEFSERKTLMKNLIKLKNPCAKVQLVISELLIHINLDHSKLENIQISRTLDLLFLVAADGFSNEDEDVLQLTKEVFREIISKPDMQEAIKMYGKFVESCQNLLVYVSEESSPRCVGLLFELISLVVKLELSEVSQNMDKIISKVLIWLPNRNCGVGCLTLVDSLVAAAGESVLQSNLEELVTAIKDCISIKETDDKMSLEESEYLILSLRLIESLIRCDASFHFKLAKLLPPPTLTHLMKPFLGSKEELQVFQNSNHFNYSYRSDTQNCYSSKSSCNDRLPFEASGNSRKRKKTSILDSYAEAVVRILSVVKILSSSSPEFKVECMEMLSQPEVMHHLVLCERSSDANLVSKATSILSEDTIPNENIESLVQAHREANVYPGLQFDALTPGEQIILNRSDIVSFSSAAGDRIDVLLGKLNGTIDKTEVKDVPLTDVMELYEYKLAAMAHTEKSLQDALAASDLQNKHLHHGLLQSKVESERLRGLLRVWEDRLRESRKEKEEVENHVDEIKSSARKLRENLVKEKTQLERENLRTTAELQKVKQEVQLKEKEILKSQKLLSDANSENKTLQKTIREEQEKNLKSREMVQKLEEEKKRERKEKEELEKENSKLEKLQVQHKKQNSELELLIRSHEETLAEKEAKIEELTQINTSLKKIQDLIHNMSGKPRSS